MPDLTYAVDTDTGTGEETVDVRRDDASPRRLRAHTDTGDDNIDVRPDDASSRKLRAHTQTGDVHLEADG